jgi:hypothetical protein
MKSALQKEAERQALAMHNVLSQYRQSGSFDFAKACQALNQSSKWHTSHETLNGDFALDEVLAQKLASNVVSTNPEASWLRDYLDGKLFDPSANFKENLGDVTVGRGNIWSNANGIWQAGNATIAQSKINNATAKITAGSVQSVKINSHMTLYNANTSGKGPPRLRVKVTGLKLNTFTKYFDEKKIRWNPVKRGIKGVSVRASEVEKVLELESMSSKMRFFNSKLGGGVLTFAPTVAFDLYDSISRDTHGNFHYNAYKFSNNEIRNQPGNVVGMGAGALTGFVITTGAALLGVTVAAPVVLVCVLPDSVAISSEF